MNALSQASINAEAAALMALEVGAMRDEQIEEWAAEVVDRAFDLPYGDLEKVSLLEVAQHLAETDAGRDMLFEVACKLIEANFEAIELRKINDAAADAA